MSKYIQLTVRLSMTNAVKSHQIKYELKMGTCRSESQKDLAATINTFTDTDFTIHEICQAHFFPTRIVLQIFRG